MGATARTKRGNQVTPTLCGHLRRGLHKLSVGGPVPGGHAQPSEGKGVRGGGDGRTPGPGRPS